MGFRGTNQSTALAVAAIAALIFVASSSPSCRWLMWTNSAS